MKGMQQNRVKNAMCVVLSNKELQYDKKTKTNLCPHQSISFQKNKLICKYLLQLIGKCKPFLIRNKNL